MRNTYYQSVGNPVQFDRLPRSRPKVEFLSPAHTKEEIVTLLGTIIGIICVGLPLIAFCWTPPGWSTFDPLDLIAGLLVLAGMLAHAVMYRRCDSLWHPATLGAVAVLAVNHRMPENVLVLLAGVSIAFLTYGIGRHGTLINTTSPVPRSDADVLRSHWQWQLLLLAGIALGLICGAVWSRDRIFPLAILLLPLSVLVIGTPKGLRRPKWRVHVDCCLSWLMYQPVPLPGIQQSPLGSAPHRIGVTLLPILLTALVLTRTPYAPLLQIMELDAQGVASRAGTPGASFFIALLLPVLVPWGLALSLTTPVLLEAAARRDASQTGNRVQGILADIRRSTDRTERGSIYLGQVVADGSPVLIPREVFGEHAHGLGDSGGGKTSLFLCPLIEQLGMTGDCSIIVIDNKADTLELLASLQAVADSVRSEQGVELPLKVFSNQGDKASFAFNPMTQSFWSNFDLFTRTDIICGANGLSYGSDYGQGYYSSANAAVLYHALKTFPHVSTFAELAECIQEVTVSASKRELHPEIRKAGVHVMEVMKRLAACQPLNVTSAGEPDRKVLEQAIDFTEVFRTPQLHYFHLSATLSPSGAPEIARLVTYMLLAAATQTERRVPVYLVIDEFQRMVASNLEYMLQLARSMGIGIILANQSMEDLKHGATNLIPPIEANCRLRQWFSVSSADDQQRLINGSGLTVDYSLGRTVSTSTDGKQTVSRSQSETVVNRFTINDVALTNDHRFRSFLHLKRGAGYAQYGGLPVIIQTGYHISEEEYRRRKALPWPVLPGSLTPRDRRTENIAAGTAPPQPVQAASPAWTEEEIGAPVVSSVPIGEQENAAIENLFAAFRETFGTDTKPGRASS